MRLCRAALFVAPFLLASSMVSAQADHVVLSEILINSPGTEENDESAEFVEIFNPTPNPVDLTNIYLTDINTYHLLPATPAGLSGAVSDHLLKFPDGTILPSGGVAVVTCHANRLAIQYFSGDIANYGAGPAKLLFEVAESNAGVPNMVTLNTNASAGSNTNLSHTNGGEFTVLFRWDGASDLVQDLDMVAWGNASGPNAYAPKSLITVDGPDVDGDASAYANEAGSQANLTVNASAPANMVRTTTEETDEVATGGNGLTGHDETTESISVTWVGTADSAATPGVTTLTATGANVPPTIIATTRSIVFPDDNDTIEISANIVDSDGTVSSAAVFVDSGMGFSSTALAKDLVGDVWRANIGPFADNTIVKFYISATDNDADTGLDPVNAPVGFYVFHVDNTPAIDDTAIRINEIHYNNIGGDIYEFVELRNMRSEPIDISFFAFFDVLDAANRIVLPEGTIIPANGYLVLCEDPVDLQAFHGTISPIVDWGTWSLNNSFPYDSPSIVHANTYDPAGGNTPIDSVLYDAFAPWPEGANGTGPSLELNTLDPLADNSDPANWSDSLVTNGTPGALNSVLAPPVANGDANADGEVNVGDVTEIYNFLETLIPSLAGDGDYDNDSDVDVDDATALSNALVN